MHKFLSEVRKCQRCLWGENPRSRGQSYKDAKKGGTWHVQNNKVSSVDGTEGKEWKETGDNSRDHLGLGAAVKTLRLL